MSKLLANWILGLINVINLNYIDLDHLPYSICM